MNGAATMTIEQTTIREEVRDGIARGIAAIGLAETPNMSRITPPTPVFAPPNGSMAEG